SAQRQLRAGGGRNNPTAAKEDTFGRATKVARSAVAKGTRAKLSYNEQREPQSLPAHIEALESEQQRLRHESESADFYKESADHIKGVLARLEQVGQELESALARWVELEERAG